MALTTAGAALALAAAGAALGAAAAGAALRAASAGVAGRYGTLEASSAVWVVVFSFGDAQKKYASADNPNARTTATPLMSFRPDLTLL